VSRLPTAHDQASGHVADAALGLDHDEFSRLVEETRPALASLARRVARNDADASDIVQEAYLRAWRARAGFRRDAEPTTWLWAIVRNTAYSHVSRRRGWDTLDDHEQVAGSVAGGEPEAATEHAALRTELIAAVRRLSPGLRAVVVLKDLHGLAHDEVAGRLGISVPAAKVRLHRARRRLHEVLRESHSPRPRSAPTSVAVAT
jgi:RNA polymerase sigma-70 factor (ECF subfamily)